MSDNLSFSSAATDLASGLASLQARIQRFWSAREADHNARLDAQVADVCQAADYAKNLAGKASALGIGGIPWILELCGKIDRARETCIFHCSPGTSFPKDEFNQYLYAIKFRAGQLDNMIILLKAEEAKQEPAPPAEPPKSDLTAIERAIVIYLRDPNQTGREVAAQVPCDPSLLSHSDKFKKLRESYQGKPPPRGTKSKDRVVETEAEE